ncbi:sulfatase family protein [Paenibacillus pasadenensis]|uniref:Choline-sulfatase n=1 Tax=Paenibacillus pasadenensis TaxID=217090 RepID=A0A2N5N4J7_9BACL|nr:MULTISPECIES: sulfatase [Paenibacillus]PLT45265.1 Choline-sulfatase [Paenibacillus pasadenensis]QGG55652.1 sulfatase-like hydrolase/transferase [Paenibacillus sp. B01]
MRILLLDLDSTRPDHLGCYGYPRNTSPHIDRIAAEGVRFENYYTSDAPCFPSRTALMTGRFGIHNGVVGHGGTAADVRHDGESRDFRSRLASDSFPALFRKAGMKTALVSPFGERHSAWTFYAGFNEIHNTGKGGMESAEEVTPVVLDWLERHAEQDDWMLYVNYWDPHTPYRAPEAFGNPFADEPLPDWITEEAFRKHREKVGPHGAREINMYDSQTFPEYPRHPGELKDRDDLRRMIDGYDCGVRHMDDNIGLILDAMRRKGVLDDAVIIVTADHGESLGELGIYGEHGTADQATCRIPMIVRWPGVSGRGTVDRGLHYHLDLPPTMAELIGLEPAPSWDGRSYAASVRDGEETGRDALVLSQCAHVCQRSVRFGDWLYIRTYHDGYHLFAKEMLFNVKEDPHEQRDLAAERPELCREAAHRLLDWHDGMMMTMDHDVDPLWTVMKEGGPYHAKGNLARYAKRLAETGRGEYVGELRKRHPREH